MSDEPQAPTQAKQFECQGCGAKMQFDPKAGKQKCPYCGHEHEVPQSEEQVRELDFQAVLAQAGAGAETEERHTVACNTCGAETTLDPNVTSDKCAFCAMPVQTQAGSKKLIKPKSLLPFKIAAKEASGAFQKWIQGLWFAPSALKQMALREQTLSGLYIPYWTYDCNTISFYRGERGEHYYVTETYRDAQGKTQTRQVQKTRWYPASGVVYNSFDDILIIGSESLPREHAEALAPWDLENLTGYNEQYLTGFRTESYQVDLAAGFEMAKEWMEGPIRSSVCRDIGGDEQRVHSVRTQHNDITFKHVLLPIWLSAYRFQAKLYRFLVNGRTGKVRGERPWSWVKIALLVVAIVAAAGAVAWLASR